MLIGNLGRDKKQTLSGSVSRTTMEAFEDYLVNYEEIHGEKADKSLVLDAILSTFLTKTDKSFVTWRKRNEAMLAARREQALSQGDGGGQE